MQDLAFAWFKRKILELTRIDLESYKDIQMHRRINFIMEKTGVKTYVEYFKLLKTDINVLEEFKNFITINVSTLFRDIDRWEELEKKYLPMVIKNNKDGCLKIWSAGCSIGAEVYSVVILLKEFLKKGYNFNYKITATDVDKNILVQAKIGIFNIKEMVNVKEEYIKKYFKEKGNGLFEVKEEIKKEIDFKFHNILDEPVGKNFDLIFCRNVLIYFTDSAKDKICGKFINSLKEGGVLFLGGTEIIFGCKKIGLKNLSMCFYQKQSCEKI